MMGHRGYNQAELVFDNCRVRANAVLGDIGNGFQLIMKSVSQIRLAHIGARAVGMAQRALEMMRTYATTRTQFGQPIGNFQMVQKLVADSATEIFGVKMMVMKRRLGNRPRKRRSRQGINGESRRLRDAGTGSRPRHSSLWRNGIH